jgi:RND family efflux transporter MFP subunit
MLRPEVSMRHVALSALVLLALAHPARAEDGPEVVVQGALWAQRATSMRSEVGGRLVEVLVQAGDRVEEGQPLFRIDPRRYELDVQRTRGRLEAQVVRREALRIDAALREETLQRTRVLHERLARLAEAGTASREELDAVATGLARAESDVKRAALEAEELEAEGNALRAEHEAARLELELTTTRAPYAGVVSAVRTSVGATVSAGETEVLALYDDSRLVAVLGVPVEHWRDLAPGQPARVTILGETYRGTVATIDPAMQGAALLEVHVLLDPVEGPRPPLNAPASAVLTLAR